MAVSLKKKNEVQTLKDVALGFSPADVAGMEAKISESLERRHQFELAQGLTLTGATSWEKAKKQVESASNAVARFFLALGLTPAGVFERQAVEGKMFNAKAIKKIVELAQFTCGMGSKLERVTKAFIACAIIASDKQPGVPITNRLNQRFLGNKDLGSFIADKDILDHLDDLRHKSMSTGAETQSSQARNVLDVLGLGRITSVERARDAVVLDLSSPFYGMFRAAVMV